MTEPVTFTATLYDSTTQRQIDKVLAFQSRDGSGGFSIWPGQVDFIALAISGISTMRCANQTLFVAAPQLLVEFNRGLLTLSARKFFIDIQMQAIRTQLQSWLQQEASLRKVRGKAMKQLEQQLVQKLIRLEEG